MITHPSVADLIVRVLFLFGYALLFGLAEIEIEGEHGCSCSAMPCCSGWPRSRSRGSTAGPSGCRPGSA
jgi:hypothetical protein